MPTRGMLHTEFIQRKVTSMSGSLRVMQWIHYHLSATATVMQVHGSIFHCYRLMWKLQCLLYLILSI